MVTEYGVIGKPLTLNCHTTGSCDLSYTLKSSSTQYPLPNCNNRTITLDPYEEDMSGEYSCFTYDTCDNKKEVTVTTIDVITAGELSVNV